MLNLKDIEKELTTNLSISELEKRLKSHDINFILDNYVSGSWNDYSTGGFLAPDEKLMSVIEKDYETIVSLKTNYQVMARIASNVIDQYHKDASFKKKDVIDKLGDVITYKIRPIVKLDKKNFSFLEVNSMGHQTCPWGCKGRDNHGYSTKGSSHILIFKKDADNSFMKRYIAGEKNIDTFGGKDRIQYLDSYTVITDLTPHLIASHYFFQGEASYRTDPKKLLEITNGLDK